MGIVHVWGRRIQNIKSSSSEIHWTTPKDNLEGKGNSQFQSNTQHTQNYIQRCPDFVTSISSLNNFFVSLCLKNISLMKPVDLSKVEDLFLTKGFKDGVCVIPNCTSPNIKLGVCSAGGGDVLWRKQEVILSFCFLFALDVSNSSGHLLLLYYLSSVVCGSVCEGSGVKMPRPSFSLSVMSMKRFFFSVFLLLLHKGVIWSVTLYVCVCVHPTWSDLCLG